MIWGILIYLAGYVVGYYKFRKIFLKNDPDWTWTHIIMVLFLALFSWFFVCSMLVMDIILFLINKVEELDKYEPPKWL